MLRCLPKWPLPSPPARSMRGVVSDLCRESLGAPLRVPTTGSHRAAAARSLRQSVDYSSDFPAPAPVLVEVSALLGLYSLYSAVCFSNFGGSGRPCTLSPLMDPRRVVDFQFVKILFYFFLVRQGGDEVS